MTRSLMTFQARASKGVSGRARATKDVDVRARVTEMEKAEAAAVLEEMGMSLSQAIRLFLKAVVEQKAIPFEIRAPNANTVAAMEEGRSGKLKGYASVEDMMADLGDDEDA